MRILSRAFPSTSSNVSTASPFIVDRRPPPDLGKWANFKRFIWNKEKHTMCNRTGASWCKVIWFYLMFLLLLLGLFFFLILGSTEYIRTHYQLPWIDKSKLIVGGSPGVGFIPNIIREQSPLLWYKEKGAQSKTNMKYMTYVNYIKDYFKVYEQAEENIVDYSNCAVSKNSSKPCIFLKNDMGPCGQSDFGYPDKKPCIYLKINKLPGWTPEYYNGDDLPDEMPSDLKTIIKNDNNKKKLWIYCGGIYPPDGDHLGSINYFPFQGIMGYYFPFTGDEKYLTPLVAIKLDNVKQGYIINIRCSAWAKNIPKEDIKTHSAFVQLYIDMD